MGACSLRARRRSEFGIDSLGSTGPSRAQLVALNVGRVMDTLVEVERRLNVVLTNASGLLPEGQLDGMRELVAHGEPGVALETLWTQLYEYDVDVPSPSNKQCWNSHARWVRKFQLGSRERAGQSGQTNSADGIFGSGSPSLTFWKRHVLAFGSKVKP
ncbi:MafI family immunity protein [Labilithrix luteola]|uniref:MafI family immunity protein n=1 Tax=Labilithrix luteola TaxID=1391654 RepID=UPI0011BA9AEB